MRHINGHGTLRFGTPGHMNASEAAVANIRVFTLVRAWLAPLQRLLPLL